MFVQPTKYLPRVQIFQNQVSAITCSFGFMLILLLLLLVVMGWWFSNSSFSFSCWWVLVLLIQFDLKLISHNLVSYYTGTTYKLWYCTVCFLCVLGRSSKWDTETHLISTFVVNYIKQTATTNVGTTNIMLSLTWQNLRK